MEQKKLVKVKYNLPTKEKIIYTVATKSFKQLPQIDLYFSEKVFYYVIINTVLTNFVDE